MRRRVRADPMRWLIAQFRRRRVSILVLLAMAGLWQILSMIFTAEAVPGEPMLPGWHIVFSRTLLSLSDYWQGGLGVPSVASGAPQSYLAAVLSILDHSVDTIVRLYTGLFIGAVFGSLLGIAVSWSPWTRRIVDLPIQFLRTLPVACHGADVSALVRHRLHRQDRLRRLRRRRHLLRWRGQCGEERPSDLHRQCPDARRLAPADLPHRRSAGDIPRVAGNHPA